MKLDTSELAWRMLLHYAKKAKSVKALFNSPKEARQYAIKEIEDNRITIGRTNANDERLTKGTFLSFVKMINRNKSVERRSCGNIRVATLTAIVYLHPNLDWQNDNDLIVISDIKSLNIQEPNDYGVLQDDIEELQLFARRVRKGQVNFRNSLLINYESKCCISDCNIAEVLDACHIEPHSRGGINQVDNGLLFRTDIHSLFDAGLLFICPYDYTVHIHPSLSQSDYYNYSGKKISAPKLPKKEYLIARWEQKKW